MQQSKETPSLRRARGLGHDPAALSRRQWIGMLLLAVGVVAAVTIGLWQFYSRAHSYLREELGGHLQDLAVSVAATVPGDSLLFWSFQPVDARWRRQLEAPMTRIRQDNDLSNIFLCLSNKELLLDVSHSLPPGEKHPFLIMDLAEVESARSGIASASRLYHPVAGTYLMTGYAPVFDAYGDVAGFVGVEASVGFFETLEGLRRSLLVVGMSVSALVLLLTLVYVFYARRLARARAALDHGETLAAMGRMTAGIAHEIRNPLGIIKNTAQLLKEDLQEQGISAELVEFIPEEVDRLNGILTGYLDFAKEAPPRMEEVELCQLLRRTMRLMEPDFENAGVKSLDNLDEVGQLELTADPRRLQQVFLNLFLNSVQAMPDGGELRVELQAKDGGAQIRVSDDGVGIDPATSAKLFEPFITSKDQGSGLGLSVARRIIVEDHGGSIELHGRPHEGTQVRVELPGRRRA